MKEKFQQFGKAMLVPISLIAISGLFLGLGSALTTELTMTSLGVNWEWYSQSFLFEIFLVIKGLGNIVIGNLGPLYAVGVSFSLARKEKGWAAFAALVAYFAMCNTMQELLAFNGLTAATTSIDALKEAGMTALEASKEAALYKTVLGFFTYNTGVFGGILVGVTISWLHTKFYKTKLPLALSFFSGTRTVPIIALVAGGTLGVGFYFIWPFIGGLLGNLAEIVNKTGLFGTFLYTTIIQVLVPFGMHPLLSTPMRWTELGGSMIVDGVQVVGNSAIQLAQLASPGSEKLLVRAFMGGAGVIDYAIYPGIALAMYKCARPENRKRLAGLLIPSIISAVFFGVTEPILFTFIFIAPWLYFGVFAPLAGLAEVACEFFKISVFQGNIKDLIPFLFRPEKLNLVPYLWILPIFFIVAYALFKFLILRFNVMTPGREVAESEEDINLISKEEFNKRMEEKKKHNGEIPVPAGATTISEDEQLALSIVEALGGAKNILDVDNCISRLRIVLEDAKLAQEDEFFTKYLKAAGVIHMGNAIQIIYGPAVGGIAADVREVLDL